MVVVGPSKMKSVVDDVDISSLERVIAEHNSLMVANFAKADRELASHIAMFAQRFPDHCRRLEESRVHKKIYCQSMINLRRIHVEILRKEKLFVQEKNKWLVKNSFLRHDMDQFFSERRGWEIQFTELYLKPLYEERRTAAQGIPSFWGAAIFCYKLVKEQITKKDEEILRFLIDIESSWSSNMKGFQLKFTFDDNHYFVNKVLTKTYDVIGDNKSVTLKAIGTEIDWNSSFTLTRSQRRKSFFCTFFDSYATVKPLSFDTKTGELKGKIPTDYEIGTKFRDKIIPYATSLYAPLPPGYHDDIDHSWNYDDIDSDQENDGDTDQE